MTTSHRKNTEPSDEDSRLSVGWAASVIIVLIAVVAIVIMCAWGLGILISFHLADSCQAASVLSKCYTFGWMALLYATIWLIVSASILIYVAESIRRCYRDSMTHRRETRFIEGHRKHAMDVLEKAKNASADGRMDKEILRQWARDSMRALPNNQRRDK